MLAVFAFGSAAMVDANAEGMETEATVLFVGDKSVVKDGVAALTRLKNGLSMRFDTASLEPGDAVTVWWVIFDDPAKCSDGACGSDDERSMIRADGHVVDSTGSALFKASLPVGLMER